MKALQYTDRGVASVEELPIPDITDDEVLVAARSVGVCHSDIDLLEGRYIIPFSYPLIPGHEWSGEVVAVGGKVTSVAPGDRVVGECVIGADHFGFSISGAAAEFFVARPEWLHRLPDQLSWTMGALVEPFSVAYYAIVRQEGSTRATWWWCSAPGPSGSPWSPQPVRWEHAWSWSSPRRNAERRHVLTAPTTPSRPRSLKLCSTTSPTVGGPTSSSRRPVARA